MNKNSQNIEKTEKSIAILGVFHFGETSDYSSMTLDDFLAPKRQHEIDSLLADLIKYQPSKIMVEYPHLNSDILQARYRSYLDGNYELGVNEIDQLGMKLAKRLGHSHIYSVDYKLDLPFGPLFEFASEHFGAEFSKFLGDIKANDFEDSKKLREMTLTAYLKMKNSDSEDLKNKNQYLIDSVSFISAENSVGIDFIAEWWKRNFHIMKIIDGYMNSEDRVLLIIGGAHRALLKSFYQDRSDVTYVEISDFLND